MKINETTKVALLVLALVCISPFQVVCPPSTTRPFRQPFPSPPLLPNRFHALTPKSYAGLAYLVIATHEMTTVFKCHDLPCITLWVLYTTTLDLLHALKILSVWNMLLLHACLCSTRASSSKHMYCLATCYNRKVLEKFTQVKCAVFACMSFVDGYDRQDIANAWPHVFTQSLLFPMHTPLPALHDHEISCMLK